MDSTASVVTVDDLVAIDENQPDKYRACRQIAALVKTAPKGTFARLMWQAFEQGRIELAEYRNGWAALAQCPDAYNGELFLKFVANVALHDPNSLRGHQYWIRDQDLPGWPKDFGPIFDAGEVIPEFYDTIALKWHKIPDPYGPALGVKLATRGVIGTDDLPDGLIDKLARTHLGQSSVKWGRDFTGKTTNTIPWDEPTWKHALLRASLSEERSTFDATELLPHLADIATAEQMVGILQRLPAPSGSLEALRHIVAYGKDLIPFLEAALKKHEDFDSEPKVYKPAPAFYLVVGYCLVCKEAGVVPSPTLDHKVARLVGDYFTTKFACSDPEFDEDLREILTAIPGERLSQIFMDASKVPYVLAAAAPTEAVCRKVARQLAAKKDESHSFHRERDIALTSLGDAMVLPLCEALEAGANCQSQAMVKALGTYGDDRAASTLVKMLGDDSDNVREAARNSLLALSPKVVVDCLGTALASGRKVQRLEAAQLLRSLPPSTGAHQLAQQCVAAEESADVRAILEDVRKPARDDSDDGVDPKIRQEIIEALLDTRGACWSVYVELGDQLLPIYVAASARRFHGKLINTRSEFWYALYDLLEHFSESTSMPRWVVSLAGAIVFDEAPEFLDRATGLNADVPRAVAAAFIEDRINRPAAFGSIPHWMKSGFGPENALDWLIEKHPDAAWDAAIAGLQHKSKPLGQRCIAFVVGHGEKLDVQEEILPLLSASTVNIRRTGVEVLAQLADPAHLPLLEAALPKERSKKLKVRIEEVIARIEVQSLDLSQFAEDEQGNAALDQRLSQLPTRPVELQIAEYLDKLPSLRFAGGAFMSDAAFRWFLGEIMAESRDHVGKTVRQVRSRLVDEDCHALCEELIKIHGSDEKGWAIYMQSIIAAPSQIDSLGERLEEFASSAKNSWGDDAVEVLVRIGAAQCVLILDDWTHRTRKNALRKRARHGLQRLADAQDISTDELIEASITTSGFDAHRQGSQVKKDIKRLRRSQTQRFLSAMTTQRRWSPPVWRERFVQHPIIKELTFGLVWGIYDDANGILVTSFLLDDDAQPVTLDFEVPTIDEAHHIGLVHPVELGDARTQWLESLADHERIQPFPQLDRPVYEKGEVTELRALLTNFDPVPPAIFLRRLQELGYEPGPRRDSGLFFQSKRTFATTTFTIDHAGLAPESLNDVDAIYIAQVSIESGCKEILLNDAPSLIYSEVLHDIHALMGRAWMEEEE